MRVEGCIRAAIFGSFVLLAARGALAQLSASDLAALRSRAATENWTFTVGENSATSRDMSGLTELKEPPSDWLEKASFDPCPAVGALPASFDWRDYGVVPPVRDQGSCIVSSWAFATVAPLECAIKITDGVAVDLSEQWLLSCNREGCDSCLCSGRWLHDYHCSKTGSCGGVGAVLETDFPYVGAIVPCAGPYQHEYRIRSWSYIGSFPNTVPPTEAMKQAILQYGPISAGVYVSQAFMAYTGGVFNVSDPYPGTHGVTIVGWDDSQGCWILRNSWGAGWGENGYMRIAYGCSSVGYSACYVDYAGYDGLGVTPSTGFVSRGEVGGPFLPSGTTYQLTNPSTSTLSWSIACTQPLISVSPTSGSLGAGQTATVQVAVNSLADSTTPGYHTGALIFTNVDTGSTRYRSLMLCIGQARSFAELFDSRDNDLGHQSVTYMPCGTSSYYRLCREPAAVFPTDPTGGTVLALDDDTSVNVTLAGGSRVSLYGMNCASFFVGSNGYITFGTADSTYVPSFQSHFSLPRIAALFDDLNTSSPGASVSYRQLTDRVAVTFRDVPLYGGSKGSSFQIEMFFDGVIRITYLEIGTSGGLAGLSRGTGMPTEFLETDLTECALCSSPGLLSITPATGASFEGAPGGPFEPSQTVYTLTNTTSIPLTWAATASDSWLTAAPSGDTYAPGESGTVVVAPSSDAQALVPSAYYGTVSFDTAAPANSQIFPVHLRVTEDPWSAAGFLNSNAAWDTTNDSHVSCATDGKGHWVSVWNAVDPIWSYFGYDYDVFVAFSTSDGTTWSAPVPLNTTAAGDQGNDITPAIATDGSGVWIAAWISTATPVGNPTTLWHVLYSRSTDNGATWSPPAYLNPAAPTETGHSSWARLASASDGKWVAVWRSEDRAGGTLGAGPHLFVSRSSDDGLHWTSPVAVDPQALTLGGVGPIPDVTCDSDGHCVLVAESDNFAGGVLGTDVDILSWHSSDFGATWSTAAPVCMFAPGDVGGDCYPRVATDGCGKWMAVWQTANSMTWDTVTPYHVVGATSTDCGGSWSTPFCVTLPEAGLDQQGCAIDCDHCGNWMVGWSGLFSGNPSKKIQYTFVSRSTNFGATWSDALSVDTGRARDTAPVGRERPCVCTDRRGRWLTAWNSDTTLNGYGGSDSDVRWSLLQTDNCAASDLEISKSGSPDQAVVGAPITYVVGVVNHGPDLAQDVVVVDGMTSGVDVISATPTHGSCTVTNAGVTWAVGTMALDEDASVTIAATANIAGEIANVATVSSSHADPNMANNTATVVTTVLPHGMLIMDDETFSEDCTNPTPGGTTGWTPLQANQAACGVDYDAASEALRVTVATGSGLWRINGWISANSEWLPYNQVGSADYVRAKFYIYRSGQTDANDLNQVPNMRMRVASRFAATSLLEVFSHLQGDVVGTNAGKELRPSSDPVNPSIYRVDFDPVDVPAMNADGQGILRGFEAYSQEPQENGSLSLTESVMAIYPALLIPDSGAPVHQLKVFQTSASDAGDLRVINSVTDGPFFHKYILTSPGQVGVEVGLDGATDPLSWEDASGVTFDSQSVPSARLGIASREFTSVGANSDRMRVASGMQYKIRYHVVSSTAANRNPQIRMRARALKFMWSNKLEIGGALAAGNSSNAIAQQALPGIGTANPDQQMPGENGGWYTMLMHTPISTDIQPAQTFISSQPGPGTDARSIRDIMFGLDLIDTISGNASSGQEAGRVTLDKIEVRSYDLVVD